MFPVGTHAFPGLWLVFKRIGRGQWPPIWSTKINRICQICSGMLFIHSTYYIDKQIYKLTLTKCKCIIKHWLKFYNYLQEPPLEPQQPSISTFLTRPVHHIRELYQILQDIFMNTSNEDSDFRGLKQVVESKDHLLNMGWINGCFNCF